MDDSLDGKEKYACARVCVCACVRVCVCACVRVRVSLSLCACLSLCVCVRVWTPLEMIRRISSIFRNPTFLVDGDSLGGKDTDESRVFYL